MVTFDNENHMIVRSNYTQDSCEWFNRMEAIIEILQIDEVIMVENKKYVFYLLATLSDMMPNEDQLSLLEKDSILVERNME